MLRSKKYKRPLAEFEGKRYIELVSLFQKANQIRYDGRMVNENTKETLEDIACSKNRYSSLKSFYEKIIKANKESREVEDSLKNAIGGMSIENLIDSFMNSAIEQLEEKEEVKEDVVSQNTDMIEARDIYKEAFDLMKSRNKKYGDSWKVLSIQSLANLCEMKLHRIANLDKIEPKIYDEMIDTLNYMVFGIMKLKQQDVSKH